MTADDFRAMALALPGAQEGSHMGHPDFRANGRIFATLGVPDSRHGMVKLAPEQQAERVRDGGEVFRPASGAWGRTGSTLVWLDAADAAEVRDALDHAYALACTRPPLKPRRRGARG